MHSENASGQLWYERPSSYWDVVCRHFPLALVSGVPLILAFVTKPEGLPLRPCTFRSLTGYPCPFCGFTRSFWALANGDFLYAFYNYPLSWLLFAVCVFVFLWNLAGLAAGVRLSAPPVSNFLRGKGRYIFLFITMLFAANWAWRLIEGLK